MWTGTVTEVVKRHIWCIIIGLVAISVGILTIRFGSSDEAVNLLSFAGVVASIILALVAILYGALSAWRSELSVGEMRRLISRGQRQLDKRVGKVESAAGEIFGRLEGFMAMDATPAPVAESKEKAKAFKDKFELHLNTAPLHSVIIFYSMAMAHKHKRPLVLRDISGLLYPGAPEDIQEGWYGYYMGSIDNFSCFLEPNSCKRLKPINEGPVYEFVKMPSGLLAYARDSFENRINGSKPTLRDDLWGIKYRIDKQFEPEQSPEAEAQS